MNTRQEMAGLLDQWLKLTRAEGAAIKAASWSEVREIQFYKAGLQKAFSEAEHRWTRENPKSARKPFRAEVGRLISLETRNAELLAKQLRRAQAQQESLNEATRNLNKVRRSYVRRTSRAAWQSYS